MRFPDCGTVYNASTHPAPYSHSTGTIAKWLTSFFARVRDGLIGCIRRTVVETV